MALVFGIAAITSLPTLVAVLMIREVPLRTAVGTIEEERAPGLGDRRPGRPQESRA